MTKLKNKKAEMDGFIIFAIFVFLYIFSICGFIIWTHFEKKSFCESNDLKSDNSGDYCYNPLTNPVEYYNIIYADEGMRLGKPIVKSK